MPGDLDIRMRLASRAVDPTLTDGLQAGIADPLWFLVRQWQFGELTATDGGSPAWVRTRGRVRHLSRYLGRLPDGTVGTPLDTDGVPLERMVENEWAVPDSTGALANAARTGAHYLRLLARLPDQPSLGTYRANLRSTYPLNGSGLEDDDSLRLLCESGIDGGAVVKDLRSTLVQQPATLPAHPALGPADATAVLGAAQALVAWFDATTGRDVPASPAWVAPRLEYQASVEAPPGAAPDGGRLTLVATEYDDGWLDWSSFDVATGADLGATKGDAGATLADLEYVSLPTPAAYPGMPSQQFWEFEDAAVDFGAVSAAPEELVTLLVIEYALRYGNDFFVVPMQLDVGSVCALSSLVVGTTFGERVLLDPIQVVDGPHGRFRLFEQTVSDDAAASRCQTLTVFPTADVVLESPVLERTVLMRDQLASMCWAIEQIALDSSGRVADRDAAAARSRPATPAEASSDPSAGTYLLRTQIADNYYPLLPDTESDTQLRLSLVTALPGRPDQGPPQGRVAIGLAKEGLPIEEVDAAGAVVERRYRYTRWIDGRHHLWIGRRRGPGQGGGDSGLRFDVLAP